jgi:hypothetical protein
VSHLTATQVLKKVIESNSPLPPSVDETKGISECLRMGWIRGEEEGNLVATIRGYAVYDRLKKMNPVKGEEMKEFYIKEIKAGADLSGADLRGISFKDKDLSGVNLSCSKLDYCDFSGANLTNADLTKAKFKNANFSGAKLDVANLSMAHARNSDFRDTSFVGTCLNSADFYYCDFSGAKFSQARILFTGFFRSTMDEEQLADTVL